MDLSRLMKAASGVMGRSCVSLSLLCDFLRTDATSC
jgi:hypothetical protein